MTLMSFMENHRSIGGVMAQPYNNSITVAASAIGGRGRIAVHGRTKAGASIGGLMDVGQAEQLIGLLREAIDYATDVAASTATRGDQT